jgi:hypothetical protein
MRDDRTPARPDEEPYDLDDDEAFDVDDALPLLPGSEPPAEADDEAPDRRSLSDEKERQRALEEVLRDQARRDALRAIAYRDSGASLRLRVITAVLVVAALLLWMIPVPGFRANIPFPLASEEEEDALRLATWVQAQQVEAFRQRRGRLPDVLREAGEPLPGMTYERIDAGTYRLSGATERTTVVWSPTDTLDIRTRQRVDGLPKVGP